MKFHGKQIRVAFFILLLFNTAFSGLMLNRAWANWHTRFSRNERAAQIEPWEWRHHFRYALDALQRNDAEGAIASLNRAYPMNPYYWPIVNNLALAYALKGDVDKATALWEQIVEMFPQVGPARHNLGIAKRVKGRGT